MHTHKYSQRSSRGNEWAWNTYSEKRSNMSANCSVCSQVIHIYILVIWTLGCTPSVLKEVVLFARLRFVVLITVKVSLWSSGLWCHVVMQVSEECVAFIIRMKVIFSLFNLSFCSFIYYFKILGVSELCTWDCFFQHLAHIPFHYCMFCAQCAWSEHT